MKYLLRNIFSGKFKWATYWHFRSCAKLVQTRLLVNPIKIVRNKFCTNLVVVTFNKSYKNIHSSVVISYRTNVVFYGKYSVIGLIPAKEHNFFPPDLNLKVNGRNATYFSFFLFFLPYYGLTEEWLSHLNFLFTLFTVFFFIL